MSARRRVLVFVAMLAMAAPASAGPTGETASGLPTRAVIETQLLSAGVDVTEVIFQEGLFNYAGPACPGGMWSCVSGDQPVVQISQGGWNIAETTSSANPCVIVQTNTTGPNEASCIQSATANNTTQRARIEQHNESGDNSAEIGSALRVTQSASLFSASFDQRGTQEAELIQRNGAGANEGRLHQLIALNASAHSVSSATSRQDPTSFAYADQRSGSGNQTLAVGQRQVLVSSFSNVTGKTTQHQLTRPNGPSMWAFVDQNSVSGSNETALGQAVNASTAIDGVWGDSTARQGSPDGRMVGEIYQHSDTGTGRYDANIVKEVSADYDTKTVIQDDDPECCDLISQLLGSPTSCSIHERVTLAGPAHSVQNARLHGRAFAQVGCDVLLDLVLQRGATETIVSEQRSGTFVDVEVACREGDCETTEGQGEVPHSGGNLHYAIANTSAGQTFNPTDASRPNYAFVHRGDILELKIELHNHTSRPISNIRLFGVVPPHTTFLDCKACHGEGPDASGVVRFNRGTGEPGGTRIGTFRVVVNADAISGVYDTSATATNGSGDLTSNSVRYRIAFAA